MDSTDVMIRFIVESERLSIYETLHKKDTI